MDTVDYKRLPRFIVILGGLLSLIWAGCLSWLALTGLTASVAALLQIVWSGLLP